MRSLFPASHKDWFALNGKSPLWGIVDLGVEDQYQYLVFACLVLSPECHGKAQNRVLLGYAPHCSVVNMFLPLTVCPFPGAQVLAK